MKWKQRNLEFRAYVPKTHYMYKDFKGTGEYLVLENDYALPITSPNIIKVQYTGVKDINGQNIFEGDICKLHRPIMKGEKTALKPQYTIIKFIMARWNIIHPLVYEILGNVFQNPELVEKYKLEVGE